MPSLRANGIKLNYRIDGTEDGTPLLLSNSLASTLDMWEPQLGPLVAAGFRVIRYDSRGHGGSDAPPGPYDIGMLAADALALLDALKVGKVHFCGLSKGGMVGQWLASHHGDRLLSATLCDTAAQAGAPEVWDSRIAAAREGGMQAVVDATLERWFTPAGRERLAKEVDRVRSMILATPVEGFCACSEAIKTMDQRESIRRVSLPTLVIVGEEDPGTPVAAARLIHERIPGSELVIIPEAAHLANVEQPQAFNQALLGFLARQGARPGRD